MTWEPLNQRLADLPLILAGPILRRTEAGSVTVWVALKEPRTVTLKIYDRRILENRSTAPVNSGAGETVPLGTNLHLVAVTAKSSRSPLQPGQIYFYDLDFGGNEQLNSAGVLTHKGAPGSTAAISYDFPLPSFALPPADLNKLRIIHGSCRKPHGESLDALAALDMMIAATASDPDRRPHQLFLTGDQIYADDVADTLLYLLIDAIKALLGWSESLPEVSDFGGLMQLAPGMRANLASKFAGFTAGEVAKSHLFTFGEYSAMYLLAWSDMLWPRHLPEQQDVYGPVALIWPPSSSQFRDEQERLNVFIQSLPAIRRTLANIPTYMIFDDHEITDDWYLNRAWCENVLEKPLGRRVLQNGLLAYALFQAWGNTPDRFEEGQRGKLLLDSTKLLSSSQGNNETARASIAHLVGLPYDRQEADIFIADLSKNKQMTHIGPQPWHGSLDWHYTITREKHDVIVLDTRTWRGFASAGKDFAGLLSSGAFQRQLGDVPASDIEVTMIVSAASSEGS